jgi:sulfatase maturation enzyme AslB (radical SAM superfamily)
MQIQSLSIDIPAACLNDCCFCVAKMHAAKYPNMFDNKRFYDLYLHDWEKRILFARDNGCNTVMLTGNGEPLLNQKMLETFGMINSRLEHPFRWIEIQTSGVTLDDEKLRFLRNHVGVNTISLSLSAFFNEKNAEHNRTKAGFEVDIAKLCNEIKRYDFNLRLSLNMTDAFNLKPKAIFSYAKDYLKADQITFRILYTSPGELLPQDKWIKEHTASPTTLENLIDFVKVYGKPLEVLPFGATKYDVYGMGVVIDFDCMNTELKESMKYLILRPNCKLYSKWDTEASLVF